MRVPFRITKLGQLWHVVRESHAQPLAGTPKAPPAIAKEETAVTFIGHSSFLIQTAGRALLIDPVFATRLVVLRRQRRPGVRIADLPPIDAVLLTHAHMDHLNRPSLRAINRSMRRRGLPAPVVIVPRGVEDLVHDLGFSRIKALEWWESSKLKESSNAGSIAIAAVPARHWGARMFRDTHRGFGGYVLQSESGPTIYHSGDTAYFSGFAEIGARLRPEVALLPIGAYFPDSYRAVHTSPEDALRAFADLEARVMIPMHYNSFPLGREPMDEPLPRLLRAAARLGVEKQVSALGEGESWMETRSDRREEQHTAGVKPARRNSFFIPDACEMQ